ncbi:helix-turn-helix domain containing protein, partial [Bacteroides ovatus]
ILVARAAPELKLHEAAEGGNVEAIKQLEAVRKRHTFERLIEQMDDDEFN